MEASKNVQRELKAARERLKRVDEDIKKILGIDMSIRRKNMSGLKKVGEKKPKAQQWTSRFKRSAFSTRVHKEDEPKALQWNSHFEPTVSNTSAAFKRKHEEGPETQQRKLRVKRPFIDRIARIKYDENTAAQPNIICTVFNSRVKCELKEKQGITTMKRLGNEKATVFSSFSEPPTNDDLDDVNKDPLSRSTSTFNQQNGLSRNHVQKVQSDPQSTARNKRMFRALMGTLQKFQDEEVSLQAKEAKRAKIEKKLEIAELRERQLHQKRRLHQMEISHLKEGLDHLKKHEEWERMENLLLRLDSTAWPKEFHKSNKDNKAFDDTNPEAVIKKEDSDKDGYKSPLEEGEIED